MTSSHTIAIATRAPAVRESLTRCCTELGITPSDTADIWLIDGHNTPALAIPKHATILVLGPIPKDIVPTTTIPTPATLDTIKEVLGKHLHSTTTPLREGWSFDMQHRTLSRGKETSISLTEKEAALLQALLQAQPSEITRETLLKSIWAYDKEVDTHTVETHIYRLRQKCEQATPAPFDLVTKDSGYKVVL